MFREVLHDGDPCQLARSRIMDGVGSTTSAYSVMLKVLLFEDINARGRKITDGRAVEIKMSTRSRQTSPCDGRHPGWNCYGVGVARARVPIGRSVATTGGADRNKGSTVGDGFQNVLFVCYARNARCIMRIFFGLYYNALRAIKVTMRTKI